MDDVQIVEHVIKLRDLYFRWGEVVEREAVARKLRDESGKLFARDQDELARYTRDLAAGFEGDVRRLEDAIKSEFELVRDCGIEQLRAMLDVWEREIEERGS